MHEGIDPQAELDRLNARRADLRNEYLEAIRQQDLAHSQPPGQDGAAVTRPMPEIEADLAKVDRLIDDATRTLEQAHAQDQAIEPKSGQVAELVMELGGEALKATEVVLDGALGGPVGQQIAQALDHLEMQVATRGMLVDALADAHVNPKDVERENALLDEIRRVDLDPALGQTLLALDEKYEQKKQELDDKIAALQSKFDERHADKGADEKQELQAKLDKQFEDLRAQLEKAQEQERQRALEAQAREQADRANAVRDARDDTFGR